MLGGFVLIAFFCSSLAGAEPAVQVTVKAYSPLFPANFVYNGSNVPFELQGRRETKSSNIFEIRVSADNESKWTDGMLLGVYSGNALRGTIVPFSNSSSGFFSQVIPQCYATGSPCEMRNDSVAVYFRVNSEAGLGTPSKTYVASNNDVVVLIALFQPPFHPNVSFQFPGSGNSSEVKVNLTGSYAGDSSSAEPVLASSLDVPVDENVTTPPFEVIPLPVSNYSSVNTGNAVAKPEGYSRWFSALPIVIAVLVVVLAFLLDIKLKSKGGRKGSDFGVIKDAVTQEKYP
ncbi:Uncharacterised protein [uncultured archaeon]|nr:Uncharacterised protein [uncultured archaeon]